MPVMLPGITFDVLRPTYTNATGATSGTTATHLTGVLAHGEAVSSLRENHYFNLPAGAMKANYVVYVDIATDINIGDILVNLVNRLGTHAPWPNDYGPQVTWHVSYVYNTPTVFLPERCVYITRVVTGGPAYP